MRSGSNSHMTDKVLEHLVEEGFATVQRDDGGCYDIHHPPQSCVPPPASAYNQSCVPGALRSRAAQEHYRYVQSPAWIGGAEGWDRRKQDR